MRPVFADPKTDFIFKRIFGSEPHKHLLIELLNTLLELEGDRRIRDLTYLPAEQMAPLPEMKLSIVDVKCVDERETEYVVEMQLFNRSTKAVPIPRPSSTSGPTSSARRRTLTSFRRSSTKRPSGKRSRWRGWRA